MSRDNKRPRFNPSAIADNGGDIDILAPKPPAKRPQGAAAPTQESPEAPSTGRAAPAAADGDRGAARAREGSVALAPESSPAERRAGTPRKNMGRSGAVASTSRSRIAPPAVYLPFSLYMFLKERTFGTEVSYKQFILRAIDRHQKALAVYSWYEDAAAAGDSESLFPSEQEATPRRKHTSEGTKQVQLSGLTTADEKVLDKLADKWGAPDRTALIVAALDLEREGEAAEKRDSNTLEDEPRETRGISEDTKVALEALEGRA